MDGSDSKPRFERKVMSGVDDTDGAGLGPHHDGLTGRPIGREVNPIEVVAIRYAGSGKHDLAPCQLFNGISFFYILYAHGLVFSPVGVCGDVRASR